jgi:Arabinose-binding domain of AraC transcription regulator, N-term
LFDILVDQGHPPSEILENVDLRADEVHSPKARTSLKQLMIACRNAIRLSRDPHLPYRIGASIHISTYGMCPLVGASPLHLRPQYQPHYSKGLQAAGAILALDR